MTASGVRIGTGWRSLELDAGYWIVKLDTGCWIVDWEPPYPPRPSAPGLRPQASRAQNQAPEFRRQALGTSVAYCSHMLFLLLARCEDKSVAKKIDQFWVVRGAGCDPWREPRQPSLLCVIPVALHPAASYRYLHILLNPCAVYASLLQARGGAYAALPAGGRNEHKIAIAWCLVDELQRRLLKPCMVTS